MKDLQLDDQGDITILAGDLEIVSGIDWIAQDIEQQMQFFSGEWFLDTTQGFPYFQFVLVKNPNLDIIQALFQDKICQISGVKELNGFQFGYDGNTRSVTIDLQAKTTNGQVIKPQAQIGLTTSTSGGSS